MIVTINEKDFIEKYGLQKYSQLCESVHKHMAQSPEYDNDLPVMFSMMMFDWKHEDGREGHLIIEATINKGPRKNVDGKMVGVDDFGIVSMKLTDEGFPDEIADRFNEVNKLKVKFNKENEGN